MSTEPTHPAGNAASHALADAELSALVAEKVAGWTRVPGAFSGYRKNPGLETCPCWASPKQEIYQTCPPYATSADAVLPLLERYNYNAFFNPEERLYEITLEMRRDVNPFAFAPTFARAACLALLKAHAVAELATPTGKDAL